MQYDTTAPPITGAQIGAVQQVFNPNLPSTWPQAPATFTAEFFATFEEIVRRSIVQELRNVIEDIHRSNGSLVGRGHIVMLGLLCAVDAMAAYGSNVGGPQERMSAFIEKHFPAEYSGTGNEISNLYRNMMVHHWNLFEATIFPGKEKLARNPGLSFGIMTFRDAFEESLIHFMTELRSSRTLQHCVLSRYRKLRMRARAYARP